MTSAGKIPEVQLKITGDGSHTLYVPSLNEHYHSTYGAIAESQHIFIQAGLAYQALDHSQLSILEIGFGTGLNAFMTCLYTLQNGLTISYTALEKYPLPVEMSSHFNFPVEMSSHSNLISGITPLEINSIFQKLQDCPWDVLNEIRHGFQLLKMNADLLEYNSPDQRFDVVFFDAFGPDVQPEMWTEEVFRKIAVGMRAGGILVTYSTKGMVKRNLKAAGFSIEKLPGPPGKREILRARFL